MANVVDRLAGLSGQTAIKQPARARANVPIVLTGLQNIDSVALADGDRVVVGSQANPIENGVYDAKTGAWTRSLDFNGNRDIVVGTLIMVTDGTDPGRILKVDGTNPIRIGSDPINFANASIIAASQDASLTQKGVTEFATRAEINADDAARAVIASEFLGSKFDPTGKHCLPIPATAIFPATTNGPALGQIETAVNAVNIKVLDYDTTTQEFAAFVLPMPESWDEGTITFRAIWTAASGAGGVAWALQGTATSDDDSLDVAYGTEQVVVDTLITANDNHTTVESNAITIGGTPQAGDLVHFRIKRVPANAGDTLGVDARLIGLRVYITTTTGADI